MTQSNLPYLVVLHGLNSTSNSFAYVLTQLNWPAEKIIRIDYQSRQRLSESVEQIHKQLPKTPLILVGHSLGGVIALLLASRDLAQIKQVITISSPLGGSKAAGFLRWFMPGVPVLADITPQSKMICEISTAKIKQPVLSIISTGGSLPTSELNDSIVSVASQRALPYGKKVEIKANHFEVLLHDRLIQQVRKFLTAVI